MPHKRNLVDPLLLPGEHELLVQTISAYFEDGPISPEGRRLFNFHALDRKNLQPFYLKCSRHPAGATVILRPEDDASPHFKKLADTQWNCLHCRSRKHVTVRSVKGLYSRAGGDLPNPPRP